MDYQQRTFHPLETIVEELEQAEQSGRHHTTDEEDEDFPVPIDLEAEPAEVQSEEDEVRLGVMRARRRKSCQGSRSSGQSPNNWPPLRVRHSQYEKIPQQSHNSYSRSEGKKTRTRTFQKSTNGTLRKMATSKQAPLPKWLVDLMVNIEEATTHQLVVE